jgi:hypothetical protein
MQSSNFWRRYTKSSQRPSFYWLLLHYATPTRRRCAGVLVLLSPGSMAFEPSPSAWHAQTDMRHARFRRWQRWVASSWTSRAHLAAAMSSSQRRRSLAISSCATSSVAASSASSSARAAARAASSRAAAASAARDATCAAFS